MFGDARIGSRLDRTARLRGTRRTAALASLAGALERDGRVDVYARTSFAELASARLGCVVHNPVVGLVDLAALCVKH